MNPGGSYVGLLKDDYNYIYSLGNETINAVLDNMELVDGEYYLYEGDNELFDLLAEEGLEEYLYYFAYMDSMWVMV